MEDKWKPLDVYPEVEGVYEISESGIIKAKARTVTVVSCERGIYQRDYRERIIKPRSSKEYPHLFVSLTKVLDDNSKWNKTVYVHKAVAQTWLPKPSEDSDKQFVEHIVDDFDNNHHSNLRWISYSELQKRNMNERYPENKNKLKEANILSGYNVNRDKYYSDKLNK